MPVFESHSRKLGLQFAQWGEIFCKGSFLHGITEPILTIS